MKCLILCLFLATIFNIAYSRNVYQRSKTCYKWDDDSTIVTEYSLECDGRNWSLNATETHFFSDGTQQGPLTRNAYGLGCNDQLTCN